MQTTSNVWQVHQLQSMPLHTRQLPDDQNNDEGKSQAVKRLFKSNKRRLAKTTEWNKRDKLSTKHFQIKIRWRSFNLFQNVKWTTTILEQRAKPTRTEPARAESEIQRKRTFIECRRERIQHYALRRFAGKGKRQKPVTLRQRKAQIAKAILQRHRQTDVFKKFLKIRKFNRFHPRITSVKIQEHLSIKQLVRKRNKESLQAMAKDRRKMRR